MYLEIKSQSEVAYWGTEKAPRGPWVNEDPLVTISRSAPDHLDCPAWHIEMTAQHPVVISSGERSGGEKRKAVIRRAEVHLTPKDVNAILQVALKEGLISVSAKGHKSNRAG